MSATNTRSSKPLEAPKTATLSEAKMVTAMNKQFQPLNEKFSEEQIAEELGTMKTKISSLLTSKSTYIDRLQSEVDAFKLHVKKPEINIEDQNTYKRWDCVIFSGGSVPLATDGENCSYIVGWIEFEFFFQSDRQTMRNSHTHILNIHGFA